MEKFKRWWWLLLVVPILALAGFVIWANTPALPMSEALSALQSVAGVVVETEPWLVFRPAGEEPVVGLIFYPGGRVDPRAYAPAARVIAANGYLVVIVPMPLNLAILSPDQALKVIDAFPQVDRWAVGGHSLGGAMASRFVYQHPDAVKGLLLWASYPAASDDLSDLDLAVISIYGTLDGLASEEEVVDSRDLLPADTRWVAVEGGNHAQFAWYGPQSGDNPATISRDDQQELVVAATLDLLARLSAQIH